MTVCKSPPALRRHKPSKQGVVTLNGHDHYLGPWPDGQKTAPEEVRDAYDALVAEWLVNGRRPTESAPPPLSVSELILQFWERYATVYYRHPDGSPPVSRGTTNCPSGRSANCSGKSPPPNSRR